jgi:hypothetical protein
MFISMIEAECVTRRIANPAQQGKLIAINSSELIGMEEIFPAFVYLN